MKYIGPERRKYPRFPAKLIVSYHVCEEEDIDVSQSNNISLGGMLLTTNQAFKPGTILSLSIRLPFDSEPVNIMARVDESKEVEKDNIFDTRIVFISVDKKHEKALADTMEYYKKKETKQ